MDPNVLDRARLDRQRHERQLNVRLRDARAAANEAARLEVVGSGKAAEAGEPAQAREDFTNASVDAVERDGPQAPMLNDEIRMIIEIRAHGRQITARLDAQAQEA